MSGASVQVNIKGMERVEDLLKNLVKMGRSPDPLLDSMGAFIESRTRQRISVGKRFPSGHKWQPWSPRYAKTRHGGQSLLQSEGGLLDSIQYVINSDSVEVGTNLVYAATHQYGDRKRRIPRRAFLGLSGSDQRDLVDLLEDEIDQLMRVGHR